jgi:hypothetical protein
MKLKAAFQSESGQILPLMAIVLSLLCAVGMALSQSILSTSRSFEKDEREFQKSVTMHMRTAYALNAVATNNALLAKTLTGLIKLYLEGTAAALDLAASVPIWEQRLPIPVPENIFQSFDSATSSARPLIQMLIRQNDELRRSLPQSLQAFVSAISLEQSLCALHADFDPLGPTSGTCTFTAHTSAFSLKHLRRVRSLNALSRTLGITTGLMRVAIQSDFLLENYSGTRHSDASIDPFVGLNLSLTHPVFCKLPQQASKARSCPARPEEHLTKLDLITQVSLQPNWSILIDESNQPLSPEYAKRASPH